MPYKFLADLVVVIHFAFVLFAVFGALFVLKWKRVIWFHIPTVLWAALVEVAGWVCPLTPLEGWLRGKGGMESYKLGFIEHYILPVLYPASLTRGLQIFLGLAVLFVNLLLYFLVYRRYYRRA
ncbi:MAG: DUF2784 domain-containing protein [Calditrichia bacterium]